MIPSARNSLLAAILALRASAASADDAAVRRGEYVFRAADCQGCHTDRTGQGAPLAGGRALSTPFGTFYSPNITPDRQTGIGTWSVENFRRAIRHGTSPLGYAYFPVFPYPSFTHMTDEDIGDLWAYLQSVPPVQKPNRPHTVAAPFGWRPLLRVWQALFVDAGELAAEPGSAAGWLRGRYLVTALGHCGECHTPRGRLGAPLAEMTMAGAAEGAEGKPVPNITPDPVTGIGEWTEKDIVFYLETGFRPDGDVAGGLMGEVIENSTRHLMPEDRTAIATYLKSLPAIRNKVARPPAP